MEKLGLSLLCCFIIFWLIIFFKIQKIEFKESFDDIEKNGIHSKAIPSMILTYIFGPIFLFVFLLATIHRILTK